MTLTSRHRPPTELVFPWGSVTVGLKQVTDPIRFSLVRQQLGLTASATIIEGRLIDPKHKPAQLKAGETAPLEWAGRNGMVRVEPYQGAITDRWRDKHGDKILLSWSTDEVP